MGSSMYWLYAQRLKVAMYIQYITICVRSCFESSCNVFQGKFTTVLKPQYILYKVKQRWRWYIWATVSHFTITWGKGDKSIHNVWSRSGVAGFGLFWERFLISVLGILFLIVSGLQEPDQLNRLHLILNTHCKVSLVILINLWRIKIN